MSKTKNRFINAGNLIRLYINNSIYLLYGEYINNISNLPEINW